MKISILSLMVIVVFLSKPVSAQDFLEVKYSVNDIKKQRDNFMNEKVKSLTVQNSYGSSIYEIDSHGKILSFRDKSKSEIDAGFNYDLKGNLISIDYRLASDEYEYDGSGNVIRKFGEESTENYYYDFQNKLAKEEVESDFESYSIEKMVYDELLLIEKVYPCSKGNYAFRYVYEYLNSGQLHKVFQFLKNCSSGVEETQNAEEYFYYEDSDLPYKMIKNSEETIFIYEYFE